MASLDAGGVASSCSSTAVPGEEGRGVASLDAGGVASSSQTTDVGDTTVAGAASCEGRPCGLGCRTSQGAWVVDTDCAAVTFISAALVFLHFSEAEVAAADAAGSVAGGRVSGEVICAPATVVC